MINERNSMKAINYIARVLPDGHLSLPKDIKEEMRLSINSRVKVILERDMHRERAIKAFGAWSEHRDIKRGTEYVEKIRAEWRDRTERIDA